MKGKLTPTIALLAALTLLPLMISSESLWLDEGDTAAYALQPDFHSWWQHLRHDEAADCQMPLAMLFAWLTAKTLGTHEWQLRAINVLWGALALLAMHRAGKRLNLPWLPLLLAIQPYFWFYTNEARPYALQLACGAWLLAAFVEFVAQPSDPNRPAWLFVLAGFFLCCSTMLAPLPIAIVFLTAAIVARIQRRPIGRKTIFTLLGGALAIIPLAIYYASTLARGAKGAQLWHVDLKFFGYVIYEFTGMTGLGLSIEKMRELARAPHLVSALAQNAPYFILPALCFASLLAVSFLGLRKPPASSIQPQASNRRPNIMAAALTAVLCSASLAFVVVGIAIQKAFWARHFAPVFPLYISLLGIAIAGCWKNGRIISKLSAGVLSVLLCLSALNLRFSSQHRKDAYREAARIAQQALSENKSVWWAAGVLPAQYYNLNYSITQLEPGKVFCPQSGADTNSPPPDVIVFSKPDIFDSDGSIRRFIEANHYRTTKTLPAFVIWEK